MRARREPTDAGRGHPASPRSPAGASWRCQATASKSGFRRSVRIRDATSDIAKALPISAAGNHAPAGVSDPDSRAYRGFDLLLLSCSDATLDCLQMRVDRRTTCGRSELRGSRILTCQSCIRDGTSGDSHPVGAVLDSTGSSTAGGMPPAQLFERVVDVTTAITSIECQPGLPRV